MQAEIGWATNTNSHLLWTYYRNQQSGIEQLSKPACKETRRSGHGFSFKKPMQVIFNLAVLFAR